MAPRKKTTKKSTRSQKTAAEKKPSGVEIGQSGTNIFSGIITEEYRSDLSGLNGIKTYDKMRKSDASVRAALLAVTLPIRRAQWFVQPATEDEADIEIKDFVESALFDYMTITWDDFLRQALLMTAYGVMVFEKVFDVKTINGATRVCWRKFAPRLPKSISAWQTKDGKDGITQNTTTGHEASIPIEKLLVFVFEKEGDNWWGNSALRPAHKSWYIKKNLEVLDSVGHERQGLGIPYAKLEKGASNNEVTKAETLLKNLRAHEQGYLVEPHNIEVGFKDMHAAGTKDARWAIEYHDRQITKSVLAQFLNLGSGPSGSRALSEDHSTLFLQAIEAIANYVVDVINRYAIPQLVDLNFDNISDYPKLDYTGIQRTDINALTTAYQRAVQAGGIQAREGDEQYLRETMGLPAVPDDEQDQTEQEQVDDTVEDLGLSEFTKKKIYEQAVEHKLSERIGKMNNAGKMLFLEKHIERIKTFKTNKQFFEPVFAVLSKTYSNLQREVRAAENDFKSWRALTFAEKKVNFDSLQDFITNTEAKMTDQTREVMKQAREEFSEKLAQATAKGDTKKIKELTLSFQKQYKNIVKENIKTSYEFGKANAAREMGVKTPGSPKEITNMIEVAADTITDKHVAEVTSQAKLALTEQIKQGEGTVKAAAAADVAAAKVIEAVTRDTARIVVAGYINTGRDTVFSRHKNKIHALQRSEILDSVTCNFCLSIDGRIVEQDDSIARKGIFHTNCRGIWVEILKDEAEVPDITGVPQSIRDRIGDATNELIQPKKPIVKKDSLAAKAINKGKAGKNASELLSTDPASYGDCGKLA